MIVAQKTNTGKQKKPYTYPEETAMQLQRELRNVKKSGAYEPMETGAQLRTEQQRTTTAAEKALYQKESELRQANAAVKQAERQLAQYTADPYVQNFEKAYAVNNTAQQRVQQTEHPWDLRDSVARERQVIRSEKRLANHVVQQQAARNAAASDRAWQRYDTTGHARDLGHAMALERQTVSPYQPARNISRWNGELERSQNQYRAAVQRRQEAERDYAAAVQRVQAQPRKDLWMDRMEREIAYHVGPDGLELMLQYSAAEQINREIKQLYAAPGTGPAAEYGPAAQLRQQLLNMGATPAQLDRWQEYGVMVNNAKNNASVVQMAKNDPSWGMSALSGTLGAVWDKAALLDQHIQRGWNRLTGSDKPIDRNTAAMQLLNMGNTTEQVLGSRLGEKYGTWAERGYHMVQDGMRSGVNTLLSGGNPWVRSVLDSGSAAAETMTNGYAAGYSDDKALNNSLLRFGGNFLLQAPVDQKIMSSFAGQGIKGALKSGGLYGAKAATVAAIETVADVLINKEESTFAMTKQAYLAQGYSESEAYRKAHLDVLRYMGNELTAGLLEGFGEFGANELLQRFQKRCSVWETAGEQLKQSGQAQAVFDRALQSSPDSAAYQIVTNSITARDAKLDAEIKEIWSHAHAVETAAGGELTPEAETLLKADIKQVWGKYQEKDRLKTSVEGMSAQDIGRVQEMLEQDALQQMKKPQLIFENDRNVKNKASQIVSVSTQIPQMVPVGQNVQVGVENGINTRQLTNELQNAINEYTGGRNQKELDDLATDPSRGYVLDDQGKKEREVGLALEQRGELGKIIRDPQKENSAEFIDTETGERWDVKSFASLPKGHTAPRKGAFHPARAIDTISRKTKKGINVVLDTRNLLPEHIEQLRNAVQEAGLEDHIKWYP